MRHRRVTRQGHEPVPGGPGPPTFAAGEPNVETGHAAGIHGGVGTAPESDARDRWWHRGDGRPPHRVHRRPVADVWYSCPGPRPLLGTPSRTWGRSAPAACPAPRTCAVRRAPLGDGVSGRRVWWSAPGWWPCLPRYWPATAPSVVVLDPTPERRAVADALGRRSLTRRAEDAASLRPDGGTPRATGRSVPVPRAGRGPAAALRVARPQATVIDLALPGRGEPGCGSARVPPQRPGVRCRIGPVPRGRRTPGIGSGSPARRSTSYVRMARRSGNTW
jgi:hypothetical protein